MRDFTGSTAIVTGASHGIGKAIAFGYAAAGMNLVLVARSRKELVPVSESISSNHGTRSLICVADVSDPYQLQSAFYRANKTFGTIHVVIANAGTNEPKGPLQELKDEDIERAFKVNVFGCINTFRAALSFVDRRNGASFISIGSGIGHRGASNNSVYAATKAATWIFTKSIGLEFADAKICVNELIPGPVKTRLNPNAKGAGWKTPDEVVPLALYLASFRRQTDPTGQSFSLMRK